MVLTAPFCRLSRHCSMPSSIQACGFIWMATKFLRFCTARRAPACGAATARCAGVASQPATAVQSWNKVRLGTAWFMIAPCDMRSIVTQRENKILGGNGARITIAVQVVGRHIRARSRPQAGPLPVHAHLEIALADKQQFFMH